VTKKICEVVISLITQKMFFLPLIVSTKHKVKASFKVIFRSNTVSLVKNVLGNLFYSVLSTLFTNRNFTDQIVCPPV